MDKILRIGFMGTPDFSVTALKAIHEGPNDLICVYSQPPRPKGRGHKVQLSPVHQYAQNHGIPVFHPKSLKQKEQQEEFDSHNLDVAIVAAYGLILPKVILESPQYGCINIHASLLSRWRGASPIQHAIWKGDKETGVTLMQMDEGLDTGPEISKQKIPITNKTTAQSLHDDLSTLGGNMIIDALNELSKTGSLKSSPQDDSQSSYAPLLKKSDGKINWQQTAKEIDCQIRALNPWPGTFMSDDKTRIKIQSAQALDEKTDKPTGTLIDKKGRVACAQGTILKINTLQPAGKKPMDIASAINGGYIKIGEHLP
ncbi:MAG: methionyl-tRNA formyltransferase [Bdellovibrionales bacterium]